MSLDVIHHETHDLPKYSEWRHTGFDSKGRYFEGSNEAPFNEGGTKDAGDWIVAGMIMPNIAEVDDTACWDHAIELLDKHSDEEYAKYERGELPDYFGDYHVETFNSWFSWYKVLLVRPNSSASELLDSLCTDYWYDIAWTARELAGENDED